MQSPIERKSSATCTREIIQVEINPKNAADDDEFYTMLEEILQSQHECVIMGDSNLGCSNHG